MALVFFQRLKSSYFLPEDKEGIAKDQQNTLFNDPHFTDRDYHINYPTIYHLRQELMTSSEPHDVRLVFLALHHILKHRGHFLTSGEIGELGGNLENSYSQLLSALLDDFSVDLSPNLAEPIKQILINKTIRRSEKLDALVDLMDREEEIIPLLAKLLVGFSVDIQKLFGEQYKGQSPKNVSFSGAGFEDEKQAELQQLLTDPEFSLLQTAFSFYSQFNSTACCRVIPVFQPLKSGYLINTRLI